MRPVHIIALGVLGCQGLAENIRMRLFVIDEPGRCRPDLGRGLKHLELDVLTRTRGQLPPTLDLQDHVIDVEFEF